MANFIRVHKHHIEPETYVDKIILSDFPYTHIFIDK